MLIGEIRRKLLSIEDIEADGLDGIAHIHRRLRSAAAPHGSSSSAHSRRHLLQKCRRPEIPSACDCSRRDGTRTAVLQRRARGAIGARDAVIFSEIASTLGSDSPRPFLPQPERAKLVPPPQSSQLPLFAQSTSARKPVSVPCSRCLQFANDTGFSNCPRSHRPEPPRPEEADSLRRHSDGNPICSPVKLIPRVGKHLDSDLRRGLDQQSRRGPFERMIGCWQFGWLDHLGRHAGQDHEDRTNCTAPFCAA
jgi:hypothetical protein